MRKAMEGLLEPEEREVVTGHLEIRQVFKASGLGNIAGCYVTDGKIERTSQVRLFREGKTIYTGTLASLKRFKNDTREVKEGFECGLRIEGYDDIKEGDVVEAFEVQQIARKLT
jgi:translation initiation factor IF-2